MTTRTILDQNEKVLEYSVTFSDEFLRMFDFMASQAKKASKSGAIGAYNTACLLFVISYLESYLNEMISLFASFEHPQQKKFLELQKTEKSLDVSKKWNAVFESNNKEKWDSSKEPYQTHQSLISLRNEIIHYKGSFSSPNKTPVKKITNLYEKFCEKPNVSWTECDTGSWVHELLGKKEFTDFLSNHIKTLQKLVS